MTSPSLHVGDILVVVFSRMEAHTLHWTICVPTTPAQAAKYHAKQSGDNWWFDYSDTAGVPLHSLLTSQTISASIKIGTIAPGKVHKEVLTEYLKPIPMAVPAIDVQREAKFTCRVWFREAIRVLNKKGLIQCSDVDSLEEEVKGYGLANQASSADWGGYKAYVSKHSK
ncbi:hypothetical protein MKEN_01356600 [Mycena kentingensis (nom. inval.)]|nr:hypothetical protein MKEN_01356600 [Mycena kentingensis (nom. inval.)]